MKFLDVKKGHSWSYVPYEQLKNSLFSPLSVGWHSKCRPNQFMQGSVEPATQPFINIIWSLRCAFLYSHAVSNDYGASL